MKLVLDTNIYCDYAAGNSSIVELIAEHEGPIFLPVVVAAELTYGFMMGRKQHANETKFHAIVEQLGLVILDVNLAIARKYAVIYKDLRKKGRPIPINDVWIAASCLAVGGTLVSRDSHFKAIESLDLYIPD